jgi:tetratricopeptide (TPR) repeat protein
VTAGADRLTALAVQEDPASAVRTTFASSCAILPAADRRVFRLLGLVPGRDATAPAVAALAGIRSEQAEQALDRLADRHLALEHTPGRYLLHDLLRVYAAELVDAEEDDASRHAALAGLAEYYRHGVAQAAARLYPHLLFLPATDLEPDPSRFLDGPEALAWLDAERSNLTALTVCLAERGHHEAAWLLDDALTGYFVLRANCVDWQVVADAALRAALAAADPLARAAAELHLGMAHDLQARFETAADHYARCAELALEAGWTACGAVALNNLAGCHWSRGRVEDTIYRLTEALELHRAAGRRAGEAVTLANLGAAHADAGQLAEAIRLYDLALDAHRQIGDPRNEAYTLRMLAAARRDLGEHEQALEPARRALRLAEETGDVRFQIGARSTLATILVRVGDVAQGLAEHEQARQAAAQMGEVRQQAEVLIDLADIRVRLGQREEALLAAQDAQSAASRSGFRVLERRARRVLDRAAVSG